MENIKLLADLLGIPEINEEKNYWLVRTQAGEYFQEFYLNNYIAIGWDEINDFNLIEQNDSNKLKEKVQEIYGEDEGRPGHVANQVLRFVNEMKSGDIILIPSKGSTHLVLGELQEDDIYIIDSKEVDDFEADMCPFLKRRKVKWIKVIGKDKTDPYLYKLLNSHHTISIANEYAPYIDRSLYSFFRKGNNAHIVFEVQKEDEIHAIALINFINRTLSTVDIFNKATNSNLNKNNIDLKINVQSPGPVEYSGDIVTILIIGLTIIGIVGGGLKFKKNGKDIEGEITSNGLIGEIFNFLLKKQKNDIELERLKRELGDSIQDLEVKLPIIHNKEINIDKIETAITEVDEAKGWGE